MTQIIFVVLGLAIFIKLIFDKWDVWNMIAKTGSQSRFKWFYKLTNCQFCLTFWISLMLTLIYGVVNGFSKELTIVPFAVSGLIHLIYQK